MATEQQLKERWQTPEGKKVRQQIIENADSNWERYLINFPHTFEVLNNRDLRFIEFYKEEFWKVRTNLKEVKKKDKEYLEVTGPLFSNADLTGANFFLANLMGSSFKGSIINNVNFMSALILKSNFRNSIIENSEFNGADLWNSNFSASNIKNSNFRGSNLTKIDISSAKIMDCKIYGISCWDIKRNDYTITKNLIISDPYSDDPIITIDDIELAQFIYLILNNKKISNLITTMRTKSVLLLSSFDNKSKLVLDKIKELLLKYDFIPIVFDFMPSNKQDLMETIRTLALLSRFVIVDLSIQSGQLHELASLVKETYIPFVTIASEGSKQTRMLNEFRHHYWFRSNYFRYNLDDWQKQIPILFENEIIPWVEDINKRIAEERRN
jgi:hypothetical protein